MILTNTLGIHKSSRIATWHSPDGKTNNQIDYIYRVIIYTYIDYIYEDILMKRRIKSGIHMKSGINARVYNKTDIGSEHNLVMICFK